MWGKGEVAGSAQHGAARTGPGHYTADPLSLSTSYMPGPVSGAGETVSKTGLPCLGEVAQERGDDEKNDDDFEHEYCVYSKMLLCNLHWHLVLFVEKNCKYWTIQKYNLKA